jgi:hypothetical protein
MQSLNLTLLSLGGRIKENQMRERVLRVRPHTHSISQSATESATAELVQHTAVQRRRSADY